MNNITITNKGNHYESSCGAWSRDGVLWGGCEWRTDRLQALQDAFKEQILDQQSTPEPTPEVEVFTGDPIENEWGTGLFIDERDLIRVAVSETGDWCAVSSSGSVWGVATKKGYFGCKFTRVSDNPGDLIAERWKEVEA